jgi:D-alanine-D-alanine ligase
MDKTRSKQVWRSHGLATPDFIEIQSKSRKKQKWSKILDQLGGGVIVKPCREGSSMGISSVDTAEALEQASSQAFDFDDRVIIERKLTGQEYTVGIIADQILPSICIKTDTDFYDFQSKYRSTTTQYLCPSGLSKSQELALQSFCYDAYTALGCTGWGRVDVITDDNGLFYLLEVNTVPGLTKSSLVPKAAEAAGIKFDNAVYRILETSL